MGKIDKPFCDRVNSKRVSVIKGIDALVEHWNISRGSCKITIEIDISCGNIADCKKTVTEKL